MKGKPKISIVVAVTSKHRCIGNDGKLLVHISDDLKRFKAITVGHPVIMGRKTFESIGHPLPERVNIVITRNPHFKAEGVIVVNSIGDAVEKASFPSSIPRGEIESSRQRGPESQTPPQSSSLKEEEEIFIIGGGEIYKQALPLVDKLYLTLIESDAEGDAIFPDWRKDFTKETHREERFDEKTGLKYTWIDLER